MKYVILLITIVFFAVFACKKDNASPAFTLLTTHTWASDTLLANGVDAGGPGGMLEMFKGDANFNKNGSGVFGQFTGTWRLAQNDTEIVISSDSLAVRSLTTKIIELTAQSLKITTTVPNLQNLSNPIAIRMTFKAK